MGFNPFINDSGGGGVGPRGPRGPQGPAGESAYEIWLDEGNTGTEQDFLDSLKGETGPQGPQGVKGETGSQGPQGEEGAAGAKGETGNGIDNIEKTSTSGKVDTYTINFTDGTASTFSVTNGTDGQNGQPGKDGVDGQPGQDGVSVTDVEVNSSNHLIVTLSDSTEVDAGEIQGRLTTLTYGVSTWNDFITAYENNTLVYCKAYSSGSQARLAFMAYVNNDNAPTAVEFQYYRSVSNKNLSNQCDQVIIYQLESDGTWTTTTRNTDVKFAAGAGLAADYANNTLTFKHNNSVTAKTTQGFAQIAYDAQGHITGSTAATTAQADAINSGITSTDVEQITTNKNNISLLEQMNGAKNHFDNKARTTTANNVTFTVQNDKSIKVTSTGAASALSLIFLYGSNIAYATNIYKNMVLCGSPSIVGSSTCFYRVLYSNNGVSQVKYDDIVSTSGYTIDDTYDYIKILIVCSSGYDAGEEGVIFKPMIIDSSMYNAGFTDYQPYAMSNAELTAKEQVNENNILYNTENGVANVTPVSSSLDRSDSGLRYTIDGDKYILSGSKTIDVSYYVVSNTIALNPNTTYTIYIDHQNNSTTTQLQIMARNGNTWVDISGGTTTGISTINTGNYKRFMVRLIPNVSVGSAVNDTVRIMITPKSLGVTSYQPYAMSNAELTAKERTNKNNILLNARNGVSNYINTPDVTISASGYVLNTLGCNIPKGDYYLKYTSTQTISGNIQITFKDSNNTTVYDTTTTSTSGGNLIPITLSTEAKTITIYSVRAGTYSNLQIISKSLYDAGLTDFQPYALSNATITPALKECVDNGAKNLVNVPDITISASGGGYVTANNNVVLPAGKYVIIFNATATSGNLLTSFKDSGGNTIGSLELAMNGGQTKGTIFLSAQSSYFNAFANQPTTVTKYMIITEAMYDTGFTDYQPYALSNAELTAKEQTNENNIYSLQAITGSYRVLLSATPVNGIYFGVYNFPRPQSTTPAVTLTVGIGTQGGGVVDPTKFNTNVYEWGFRVYTTEASYAGLIIQVTVS